MKAARNHAKHVLRDEHIGEQTGHLDFVIVIQQDQVLHEPHAYGLDIRE